MSMYTCRCCGSPTDNDQSFDIPARYGCRGGRIEVHRCDKCDKRFHQELEWESEGETIRENNVICPYCEYEYSDYDGYQFDEGKTEEVECPECGGKFDVEVEVIRTYSTKRSLSEMPDNYGEGDDCDD